MKIEIFENMPIVRFSLFDKNNNEMQCDFLIDTWFTESVVLIVDKKNSSLLKIIDVYWLKKVDKSERLKIWDWSYAETFEWKIYANLLWKEERVDVLIVNWERDEMPLIWIEFLKQNKKKLNLDFKNDIFELE